MVVLEVYGRADATDGYVRVVERCVCDGRDAEEEGRRDEEEDGAQICSQQGWGRRDAYGQEQ